MNTAAIRTIARRALVTAASLAVAGAIVATAGATPRAYGATSTRASAGQAGQSVAGNVTGRLAFAGQRAGGASQSRAGCAYSIHIRHSGGRLIIRVTGSCNGQAPKAGRIARDLLASGMAVPADMHVFNPTRHSADVCFGDCDTSAHVWETAGHHGKAVTS